MLTFTILVWIDVCLPSQLNFLLQKKFIVFLINIVVLYWHFSKHGNEENDARICDILVCLRNSRKKIFYQSQPRRCRWQNWVWTLFHWNKSMSLHRLCWHFWWWEYNPFLLRLWYESHWFACAIHGCPHSKQQYPWYIQDAAYTSGKSCCDMDLSK